MTIDINRNTIQVSPFAFETSWYRRMASRLVAWTSRIFRRGGSPGAVSSLSQSGYRLPHHARVSHRLTAVRASTRKSIIAHAPLGTRIDGFKYRNGMSNGAGSAPWPVHRNVLSRFPPKPTYPSVRVHFPDIIYSTIYIRVTCVYKLKIIIECPRVPRIGLYPIETIHHTRSYDVRYF